MIRLIIAFPLLLAAACSAPGDIAAADNDATANAASDASANATQPAFAEVQDAHPTAPEPAPIPAKFRGTWAENEAACADLSNHSRLTISGRTVRHPDFVIFGDSFTFPTPDQLALKGKIEATGAPIEAHYSINAANDELTDEAGGGAVRVRCA